MPPNSSPDESADESAMDDKREKPTDLTDLERIFAIVAEAPEDRRASLLDQHCADAALKAQVLSLLRADSDTDGLLDHTLYPEVAGSGECELIEGYELRREIGRGGMGVVYEAEQHEPVRRNVALKVIKPGVDTREVIARFQAERHALSLMDHPNIARVLDAGTAASGRPYFVMELVDGRPITEYCNVHELNTQERLELFLTVCQAIQHAHQKGIIHRDIKPSNVLVTEYDGRPVAKVIDFGVAKAINQSLSDVTIATGIGQIIGTFEYMSPEQSQFNKGDVDTRSDIYSLGVLLYELLTGKPPFDKERLRTASWEEMLRIIREEEPSRPSLRNLETQKSHLADASDSSNSGRRFIGRQPSRLGRLVRNELDWIVMKAMEKDRNRRYETPSEFANDIECFLKGAAVSACPPSAVYRFRKFANRNRVVFATSTIVAISLVLGLIGTTWQAVRARSAEKAAEASFTEARAINAFLQDHLLGLAGADPLAVTNQSHDSSLPLESLLNRVRTQVEQRFFGQPRLEAKLKDTLANSFRGIGRSDVAASLYEDVLHYARTHQADDHAHRIDVMRRLGRCYIDQSRLADAERVCEKALEDSRIRLGNTRPLTLLLRHDLATLYLKQGKHQQAEVEFRNCHELRKQVLGVTHPDTLETRSGLAVLFEERGWLAEAIAEHEEVLAIQQDVLPPNDLRIAHSLSNLGRCWLKKGRNEDATTAFANATSLLRKSLDTLGDIRHPDHPVTLQTQWNLVQAYCELNQYADADAILAGLLPRLQRLHGPKHAATADALNTMGWIDMHLQRFVEAEIHLTEVIAARREQAANTPAMVQSMGNLAIVLHRMGKIDDAIRHESDTLALATDVLGPEHPETLSSRARLGMNRLLVGQTKEGRADLVRVLAAGHRFPGQSDLAGILARSFHEEGDVPNACHWIDQQVQLCRAESPEDPMRLAGTLAICGERLMRLKKRTKAEDFLRESLEIHEQQHAESTHVRFLLGEAVGKQ